MAKPKLHTWACRCGVRYSVSSKDQDLHLLPKRFKCWAPKCRFYMTQSEDAKPAMVVRAMELYQVLNNLGTEEERACSPEDLRKLIGKPLIRMELAQASDKDRSIISSFTLEGGITVHLAPSTKGVTVYKVVRE